MSTFKITITDQDGKVWASQTAVPTDFKTGSTGHRLCTKIINPDNPKDRYQVNANFVLIGSKTVTA